MDCTYERSPWQSNNPKNIRYKFTKHKLIINKNYK